MNILKSPFLKELQERGFIAQITHPQELDDLMSCEKISAYIGFDCTANSLHVGSLMQIMILRLLQKHGHRPIILLGGGTTKIGDPSGKDEARQILNEEKIAQNLNGIKSTLEKFFSPSSLQDLQSEVRESAISPSSLRAASAVWQSTIEVKFINNDEWLRNLNYIEFLRDIGKHFSVNRMLTFDSVKARLERDQPLSFLEFNYMILQAYDFYELNKREACRLQIGGSDQWGNIVNGVELIRRAASEKILNAGKAAGQITAYPPFNDVNKQKASWIDIDTNTVTAFGLTSPLITTSDGKKMGKTADGAVWLDAEKFSPFDYFQFFRNTHDNDVIKFLKFFTDLDLAQINELAHLQGHEINKSKEILAFEATKICHGEIAAENALQKAREIFISGNSNAYETKEINVKGGKKLTEIIKEIGAAESNSQAKKLIEGKGVKLNDEIVKDPLVVGPCEFNLQIGKKRFFKIICHE